MMNISQWKFPVLCGVFLLMYVVSGCNDDSSDDEAQNPILRVFHAVSDMGTITFLMDESAWANLEFGDSISAQVDPEQYETNFDTALPDDDTDICLGDEDDDGVKDDDECTRLAPGSINLVRNQEYLLVLFGQYNDLEVLEYEKPYHEFDTQDEDEDGDAEDENMEVQFVHLAESLGQVDVYLEPPGTNLSPTQAIGTLSLKGEFHTLVDEDDYVLTLTAVADPGTVYFTSNTFSMKKQSRVIFAIRDSAGDSSSAVKVQFFGDQDGTLTDRNADTTLRIVHAVADGENIDVFSDNDFSEPFASNLEFGQASDFITVFPGSLTNLSLDVTPAGDPGIFLARENVTLTRGTQNSFYLIGETDNWDGIKSTDDRRRLTTHARLKLINGANSTVLDFYIAEPNSNIGTLSPTASLAYRLSTGYQRFDPGTYEIVLTYSDTSTIVYGPQTIELSAGGLYTIIATTDTSDPTAAGALLLDDFVN